MHKSYWRKTDPLAYVSFDLDQIAQARSDHPKQNHQAKQYKNYEKKRVIIAAYGKYKHNQSRVMAIRVMNKMVYRK